MSKIRTKKISGTTPDPAVELPGGQILLPLEAMLPLGRSPSCRPFPVPTSQGPGSLPLEGTTATSMEGLTKVAERERERGI